MFSRVFSRNSRVKVKAKGMGRLSFLIEAAGRGGQPDGKDISHNRDTKGRGGVGSPMIN